MNVFLSFHSNIDISQYHNITIHCHLINFVYGWKCSILLHNHFYPRPIRIIGHCRAARRLSVCLFTLPSRPRFHSTAQNIQQILIIFGAAIGLSGSMDAIGNWGFYVHVVGSSGTLKYYESTDLLVSWTMPIEGSRPLDAIFFIKSPQYTGADFMFL